MKKELYTTDDFEFFITLYNSGNKEYKSIMQIDFQSFFQTTWQSSVTPLFTQNKYEPSQFLDGKSVYSGKLQINAIGLNPMLKICSNLSKSYGINVLQNYVIYLPQFSFRSKDLKNNTTLIDCYLVGYQFETTPDGQPQQIVHNILFKTYDDNTKIIV